MSSTDQIVTLNVSVTEAPLPSNLQQSGAFVTQGGTDTAAGTLTLVPNMAALTAILAPALAVSAISWSADVVTVTTSAPHGWGNGDVIPVTLAQNAPAGYNGRFTGTVTGTTTVTYPLLTNPGAETTLGTIQLGAAAELAAMGTTFFAGLNQQAPYVLELGEADAALGPPALTTWIDANPGELYSYMVPREWNDLSAYATMLASFEAPNALTYFFTTGLISDVTGNPPAGPYAGNKAVFVGVEAPAVIAAPETEFDMASPFSTWLSMNPSSTNRATPLSYTPTYGTTPYPTRGNAALFTQLDQAAYNRIATGQEGGISSTILKQGLLQDQNQAIFWWSADWMQINSQLNLANEVINGSVPGGNPLYYDQDGINRLSNRLAATARTAVSYGLANGRVAQYSMAFSDFQAAYNAGAFVGQIPINAEPFSVYTAANPSDYRIGKYGGLACVYTPILGFINLVFNLNITNLLVP